MATFDGSTSLDMASVDFREHECGPCAGRGKTREAIHYCIDCPDYLCDDCKDYHGNLAGTRDHVSRNLADLASSMSFNLHRASDEFREHECDPCLLSGKTREAIHYCVDCPSYLCDNCRNYHGKLAGTKNHTIVSSSRNLADLIAGIKTLGSVNSQRKGSRHSRQDNKLPGKSHSTGSTKMLIDRKIKSHSNVKVRTSKDKKDPSITGCTVMPNGHVVLCDRRNNQIKLLDDSWAITGRLALQDPWDVSVIDSNNVIVSSPGERQLQKVQVFPEMKAGSITKLDKRCYGVAVSGQEIYTTCHDDQGRAEVRVLDLQGNFKRRINSDGSHLFTSPYYIAVSASGQKIFISDWGADTITCLTPTGTVIYTYKDGDLRCPTGLICDSGDNVLVCGGHSDNVHTISPDGNKYRTLITYKDGLTFPRSIAYKESEDTLIVGCKCSNKVRLFKLA